MRKRLQKQKLSSLIQKLKENATVIAPVMTDKNEIEFLPVESEEIVLSGARSLYSPKEYIFPKVELMYEYKIQDSGKASVKENQDNKKQIIFGIRPCDLHAIEYMKEFYSGKYKDSYIIRRMDNSVLIGLACSEPSTTCFCTSLGNSPIDTDGSDIMMAEAGSFYFVKGISVKGKKLIENNIDFFEDSEESDDRILFDIKESCEKAILDKIDVTALKNKIGTTYNSNIWKKYSDICVNCGACTFNCPTCTCFDVADSLGSKSEGCHYRTWDTCQNFAFTLHASGHNPRSTSEERLRQRVLHKYHYTVVQMDQFSCTGCGRCTQSCPVGISMMAILKDIKEVVDNGEE
jgi:ferredoxin